jgi:hypothetical protein
VNLYLQLSFDKVENKDRKEQQEEISKPKGLKRHHQCCQVSLQENIIATKRGF